MKSASNRKLMITVDVEAQPGRADSDHVDRLIWGRYPGDQAGGIGEMMDSGDRHSAPIVMFVDYCERALYGEAILDVGREVHRRGHDLQLHAHPEFLADTFWSKAGLTRPGVMNTASDAQAEALFDYLCRSQQDAGGTAPLGYRGGGYRYGPAVLRAMAKHGVKLNSSYIAARDNQPLKLGRVRQFYWDNGCLEVPVSCVNPYLNLTRDFDINFNASAFHNADRMMQCLDSFYKQQGNDAIAVMVMHSWSFSKRQDDGLFSPPLAKNLERFDDFLSRLAPAGIEVITCARAVELVASSQCAPGQSVSVELINAENAMPTVVAPAEQITRPVAATSSHEARPTSGLLASIKRTVDLSLRPARCDAQQKLAATSALQTSGGNMAPVDKSTRDLGDSKPTKAQETALEPRCNVCQTPLSSFEDFNGRPKARCPKCGSVERQRVFVEIYDQFLCEEFDLTDKHILALSPSHSEKMIYGQRGIGGLVSCDIQPQLNTDIVADITNMPQVPCASFDAVIASYVMTCVHDLDAALSEIHRILKPGGRFLFCDPLTFNAETVEHTEIAKITSWYGREAYDKYKIGSFRRLGDQGTLQSLAHHGFQVKTFYGRDPITRTKWVWHAALKMGALASKVDAVPTPADHDYTCSICGTDLAFLLEEQEKNCPKCSSRPRTRTLPNIISEHIAPLKEQAQPSGPLLAFAMTSTEEKVIRKLFPDIVSASLYGNYRSGHIEGVDIRDLSRFDDQSFSAISGILLFDYVIEMEQALAECYRALSAGGILFTHIAKYRLLDGMEAPRAKAVIKKRDGYFDYVPSDANMPSIKVGLPWFIEAMKRAGFEARHIVIEDKISRSTLDWFIGVKPGHDTASKSPDFAVNPIGLGVGQSVRLAEDGLIPTKEKSIKPSVRKKHTYRVKLPVETGLSELNLEVASFDFGNDFQNIKFAEHVVSGKRVATDTVVGVMDNVVLESDNLGAEWRARTYNDTSSLALWNCFSPSGYRHRLLQTRGWEAEHDARQEGANVARLLLLEPDGRISASGQCGTAAWHGTHSIDEAEGTMIFGEYHSNNAKHRAKPYHEAGPAAQSFLRSNSLFRSSDGGASWTCVLQQNSDQIRHFHVVRADPRHKGRWWATTGDKPGECRFFRSDDDGLTWRECTNFAPDVPAPPGMSQATQACQRTTVLTFYKDRMLWGADDIFGSLDYFDRSLDIPQRTGARFYASGDDDPIRPEELAYCGHPVRSMVDVGPGYIVFTEAYQKRRNEATLEPEVLFWSKLAPSIVTPIAKIPNFRQDTTGFTYSRASQIAINGTFFTYRGPDLGFIGRERMLRWRVQFN